MVSDLPLSELYDLRSTQESDVKDMLRYCYNLEVSDICIKSGNPVFVKKDGYMQRVSIQELETSQVVQIAQIITTNDGIDSILKGTQDYDTSFELSVARRQFIRFRVNVMAVAGSRFEVSIVMRTIPETPPPISELEVEPELLECFFPSSGLVIVTGPTGSGKTTLLASAMRHRIENETSKIGTYEAPIEYNLSSLDKDYSSYVTQCEIGAGRNLPDFAAAARNALRCAHDVVMLGEARDFASIRGLAELAEQGTMTYATMHTNSTYDVFSRIIATVGEANRGILLSFISSLRCVIHQRLVPRLMTSEAVRLNKPGRVAIREYFILDEDIRRDLILSSPDEITHIAKEANCTSGSLLSESAKVAYERGDISEETYFILEEMRS